MKATHMLRISRLNRAAAAAAVAVLTLAGNSPAQTETVRLSGSSVAVYNLAGRVSISAGSGQDVTVTVRRGGADADRLEVRSGSVEVRRGDWGPVETLRVIYPADRVRYDGMRGTTQLRVREDGTFWGGGWNGREGRRVEIGNRGGGLEASADLEISVPRGKRILVALAAGTIDARNVDGDLFLDTGSGDITARGASGILNLDTGSGNVTVDGADGDVSIDTGSGNVEARSVRAPALSVDTGSGDVTVSNAEAREVEIDTGSGGVTVSVPADYAGDVRLETGSGRMATELPITLLRRSDDEIVGRIGEGGSARIEIETGSGDIRIHRT